MMNSPQPAKARRFLVTVMAACAAMLTGCSNQKGGDHVPELETYLVAALPDVAFQDGLTAKEVSAQYFRRFVHISESYTICLPNDSFTGDEIGALESAFKSKDAASINKSGLEIVINRALATVTKYNSQRAKFSSRIELKVTDATEAGCHAVLRRAKGSEFPFQQDLLKEHSFAVFYAGQLATSDKRSNKIPVIYINSDRSAGDQILAMKQSTGVFLGLGSSSDAASLLNTDVSNSETSLTYGLENGAGETNVSDDAAIIYGFALMYQDVLKPADLSTFQYYADDVAPGTSEKDSDLIIPTASAPIAYTKIPGSRYIEGVRAVTTQIQVCVQNLSSASIATNWWTSYIDFASIASESRVNGGLFFQLHSRKASFAPSVQIVTSGCNVLVVAKNASQYPFATNAYNGLYAPEGRLRDSSGASVTIPVIYLNATNLTLDPQSADVNQGRYMGDVLQHEFAHLLGFRHSTSKSSILAPSGDNRTWDMSGGDADMMQSFIAQWQKQTGL